MSEVNCAPGSEALVVLTTTESAEAAAQLAQELVERALAACVQIVAPITSIYRWQGKLETASEHLLVIKTTSAVYTELEAVIKQLHSYQTPEVLALPVTVGSSEYLAWLQASVKTSRC